MNTPLISIIIPCYNQGIYLQDALASLSKCDNKLFEVVIVNDGSTDNYTNNFLQQLSNSGYNVIFQQNMGLGEARNSGIKKAKGTYILPLDADNKIFPEYITYSIKVLSKYPNVAVVYGNAEYFGDKVGILKPGAFNLQKLMLGNYIDACAVIRKDVIEKVGFYDKMEIMGYEDWDLWLRISFNNYDFFYIDKVLFSYRYTHSSMMRNVNKDIQKQNKIEEYLSLKYSNKLSFEYANDFFIYRLKKAPFTFIYKLILKKIFPKYYQRLVEQNKIYAGHLLLN